MGNEIDVVTSPIIPWYRQKTTWAFICTACTILGAYFGGDIGLPGLAIEIFKALAVLFGGAAGIFMRQGVEKSKNPTVLPLAERGEELK